MNNQDKLLAAMAAELNTDRSLDVLCSSICDEFCKVAETVVIQQQQPKQSGLNTALKVGLGAAALGGAAYIHHKGVLGSRINSTLTNNRGTRGLFGGGGARGTVQSRRASARQGAQEFGRLRDIARGRGGVRGMFARRGRI
jgi:hypothetical protein